MDSEAINQRIEQIIGYYELNAATFADKINVPRSSISHILNGRNKPSLDFVMKVVEAFQEVDLYWLLYGVGRAAWDKEQLEDSNKTIAKSSIRDQLILDKSAHKIVVFYKDGTFKEYLPES